MIVPVLFEIQREGQEGSLVFEPKGFLPQAVFEKVRIKLLVANTEDGLLHGFSALVMFDHAAEPGHELMTLYQSAESAVPSLGSKDYMRQLRDRLNDLLDEGENA